MDRRSFLSLGACASACVGVGSLLPGAQLAWALKESSESYRWFENSRPLMGTFVSIAVFLDSELRAREKISDCFSYIEKSIGEISSWNDVSDTSILNERRQISLSECSDSFVSLARQASHFQLMTEGLFNPLSKDLNQLWREAREQKCLPARTSLEDKVSQLKGTKLSFSDGKVCLSGGAKLDFGGIGKGYIADLAREYLATRGVSYARVDCGGDLAFYGSSRWKVDLVHPREEGLLGTLELGGTCSVATSGDYHNNVNIDGRRIHHLLDCKTGWPASACQSVTVVAPTATMADALATAVFLQPVERGLRFLKAQPQVEGLIVGAGGEIVYTRGIKFSKSHRVLNG